MNRVFGLEEYSDSSGYTFSQEYDNIWEPLAFQLGYFIAEYGFKISFARIAAALKAGYKAYLPHKGIEYDCHVTVYPDDRHFSMPDGMYKIVVEEECRAKS